MLSDKARSCPCIRLEKDKAELCKGKGGSFCEGLLVVAAGAGTMRCVVDPASPSSFRVSAL